MLLNVGEAELAEGAVAVVLHFTRKSNATG
jgi:hypothetical protein